jgi:acyl-homoserine lactone acylase PvdQ
LWKAGKREQALEAYRARIAVLERLTASEPNNTEWQRELAFSYASISATSASLSKQEETAQAYTRAVGILEQLLARDPNNRQWQRDIARLHDLGSRLQVASP